MKTNLKFLPLNIPSENLEEDLVNKINEVDNFNYINSSISTKNLYNPYTRVYVKTNTDGTKVYTSDFIPVEENSNYYYTRPSTANSSFIQVFNSSQTLLRTVLYPYVTTNVGDAYVKLLQVNGTTDTTPTNLIFEDINVRLQFEKSKFPTAYEPYLNIKNYQLTEKLPAKLQTELFTNKICYSLGDSITHAGFWTSAFKTASKMGQSVVLGSSGATWVDNGATNNIKERIDALETSVATYGTPDIVIIALGTNDWGNNLTVGDYATTMAKTYTQTQTRTSVYDAVKYGVTRIKKLYPNAFIVLTTPVQRSGKTDTIYVDAIKNAGKMMSVPVIDVYANSGLIPYDDWLTLYYSDGLHETSLGGEKHGKYVANELLNIYYK